MWTSLIGLLKNLFLAVASVMDYLDGERLRKLGAMEQEQLHVEEQRRNEAIADEVDARPTPRDKRRILDGLRKPPRPDA